MFLKHAGGRSRVAVSALLIAGMVAACSDKNPTGNPADFSGMSATIDGVAYLANASDVTLVRSSAGGYGISARPKNDRDRWLSLSLAQIGDTGVYPLGADGSFSSGNAVLRDSANTKIWETPFNGAVGTIHITTLTASRIAGTFTMIAVQCPFNHCPYPNAATGTRQIANGRFDLPITPSSPVDTSRKKFRLVFDGTVNSQKLQPIHVGCVLCAFPGANTPAGLSFHIYTDRKYVSVFIQNFTGVGTYALSETPNRSIWTWDEDYVTHVISDENFSTWYAGSTGSITVTKVENGRVALTFAGTLRSNKGGLPVPVNVAMEFSMFQP